MAGDKKKKDDAANEAALLAMAKEVKRLAGLAGAASRKTLEAHRATGAKLLELRAAAMRQLINWDKWCPVHCGMTPRHARRIMNIATGWAKVEPVAQKREADKDGPLSLVEAEKVALGKPIRATVDEAKRKAAKEAKEARLKAQEAERTAAYNEQMARWKTYKDTVPQYEAMGQGQQSDVYRAWLKADKEAAQAKADEAALVQLAKDREARAMEAQAVAAPVPDPVPPIPPAQADPEAERLEAWLRIHQAQADPLPVPDPVPTTPTTLDPVPVPTTPTRFRRQAVEEAIAQAHAQVPVDVVAAILAQLGLEVV